MGRLLGAVVAVVVAAAALVFAYVAGPPPALVFAVGAGVLSLVWLLLLLTLPWNLYFRAHTVLAEIAVSDREAFRRFVELAREGAAA